MVGVRAAVLGAGRAYFGHHRGIDAQGVEQLPVPLVGVHVEEHGARCIADIGGVDPALSKLPDQPRVNRAERQPVAGTKSARIGRSDERRGGNEWLRTCRYRWLTYQSPKNV